MLPIYLAHRDSSPCGLLCGVGIQPREKSQFAKTKFLNCRILETQLEAT